MLKRIAPFLIAQTLIPTQIAFAQNSQPSLNQKLGMYSKPSVVRIGAGCIGTYKYKQYTYPLANIQLGTGYFINSNGYILTNAHVVEPAKNGEKGCKDRLFDNLVKKLGYDPEKDKARKAEIEKNYSVDDWKHYQRVYLPKGDSFPFEIKVSGTPIGGGSKDVAVIKIEVKNAPVLEIGDSDTVNLQDDVIVIGYPTAADSSSALSTESKSEASVAEGKVANTNKKLQDHSPVLQINVQAANGSSGSPVLNNKGQVVGIITFGLQDDNGGIFIPFAIPTNTIQEFIRQSGTINEQGVTDSMYKQGLDFFWKGDYEGAKTKFDAVKELFPQHSEVDRLISDSQRKLAENWQKTNYTPWLLGVVGFLGIAVVVLLFLYLGKRNRSGVRELQEYTPEPTPEPVEEFVTEQPVQRATLQAGSNGFTHPYQPGTLMSLQTTYVELKNPQGDVRTLNLQGQRYQLGRDRNWSDIDLSQPGWDVISNRHAIFRKEEENYRIFDGDGTRRSTNGIWINGKLIDSQQGHLLQDGDQLKIGQNPENQVTLTYHNPASKQSFA